MFVEDNEDIGVVVTTLLRDEGFGPVIVVGSAAEALRELALPTPTAIVLLDVVLQEGRVEEILDAPVSRAPPIATLLVTASNHGDELAETYGIGCVPKPFSIDALLVAIDATILQHRTPTRRRH